MRHDRTQPPIRHRCTTLALLLLMATATAHAQYRQWMDTTIPTIKKPYGVGESEFLIGSYKYYYNNNRPVTELWDFYASLGISTVILCNSHFYRQQFDSFLLATNRPQNGRVIVADSWKIIEATSAREIEFYPFDSSQSRKWGYNECVALSYDDDAVAFNPEYAQGPNAPREAIYDTADAGTLALGDIAYNYRPAHIYPYRIVPTDTSWRAVSPDSLINRWQLSFDYRANLLYRSYRASLPIWLSQFNYQSLPHRALERDQPRGSLHSNRRLNTTKRHLQPSPPLPHLLRHQSGSAPYRSELQ
ncbi:MAG: hypothetical protein UZ07_CHB004001004 [Chlorobi bacterium OLB7]|nr:MAG: hypothetical protein UZ07_CHB004001004 [Chlorobi bacterium OLB7]